MGVIIASHTTKSVMRMKLIVVEHLEEASKGNAGIFRSKDRDSSWLT